METAAFNAGQKALQLFSILERCLFEYSFEIKKAFAARMGRFLSTFGYKFFVYFVGLAGNFRFFSLPLTH
ncbi:hypothetical protein FFF34_013445 [Inquilinus sp. KBS0705]|nr:hypothetical protein FFF34_013445 [Inquilinus sp. KBS0705]